MTKKQEMPEAPPTEPERIETTFEELGWGEVKIDPRVESLKLFKSDDDVIAEVRIFGQLIPVSFGPAEPSDPRLTAKMGEHVAARIADLANELEDPESRHDFFEHSEAGEAAMAKVAEAVAAYRASPALTVAEVVDAGPDEAQGIVGSDGGIYKAGAGVTLAVGDGFHVVEGSIAWPNEADARHALDEAVDALGFGWTVAGPDRTAALLAGAEGALAAAAASAVPGSAPTADPAVVDAFKATPEQMAATVARIHAEGRAAEFRLMPLLSLEAARALPEVSLADLEDPSPALGAGAGQPYTSEDPREITAFKDADGRTMLVVMIDRRQRLAKLAKPSGAGGHGEE